MSDVGVIRRRRVPRREFTHRVGLLIRGRYYISRAVQIGEGGMMIQSPVELAGNQQIVISFKLPNLDPDVVRGAVRYQQNDHKRPEIKQYGIEFLTLDFKVKREIRNYVADKSYEEAAKSIKKST